MSRNNPDNNDTFEDSFAEDAENFNPPEITEEAAPPPKKSKIGLLFFLMILGVGGYLGYRYYFTSTTAQPNVTVSTLKVENNVARQAQKNANFEQLKQNLFNKTTTTTTTTTTKTTAAPATPTATIPPTTAPPPPTTAAPPEPKAAENLPQVAQVNERLEVSIQQIQHLEAALQGITQTIARLNGDINAIDNRLSMLANSTASFSNDIGNIKNDISSVKRVLGEEGILDNTAQPATAHVYTKTSQMARTQAPPPTYVVHAIIPGRAWLKSLNGQVVTVTEGDILGDYGKSWLLMSPAAWYSPVLATPSSKKKRKTRWYFYLSLTVLWLLWASPVLAVDLQTVTRNLRNLVIPLTQMLLAFSFLGGIFFIFKALGLMKKFGMMNNMHAQPGEFVGPLAYFCIGAVLIWIPSTSGIMTTTIFGSSAPDLFGEGTFDYSALGSGSQLLTYIQGSSLQTQWIAIIDTLVLYIQFIGLLAFIRGWFIVAKASQPGHQPGSMGKGITHIVGGILAINFIQFINMIRATLGM